MPAKPKIADYPFTTLQPNLGVVVLDHRDLVLADIPGLIEGAHEGAGLGHQFLRHIERCRLLIHLVNGASADPLAEFEQINEELALFSEKLAQKKQLVVLNKIDLPQAEAAWPALKARAAELGLPACKISAVTQAGVRALVATMFEELAQLPEEDLYEETEIPIFTLEQAEDHFEIHKLAEGWQVTGPRIEKIAIQTFWDWHSLLKR